MVGAHHTVLDTIMDRFRGVQLISLAAVFCRRSRHGCYMMTTITRVSLYLSCVKHSMLLISDFITVVCLLFIFNIKTRIQSTYTTKKTFNLRRPNQSSTSFAK